MKKNFFLGKNTIVIFVIAILCTSVITYSFIRSSNNANVFSESGYVHVSSTDSEDKRVLFSSGTKYKNAVNSQIKFTDVSNIDRNVSNNNFIHYDDNSIAAFCDGVIVDIDELASNSSTMNHFHISPGINLRNTGSSFAAENSGMKIDFSNFLWKISDDKYLAISKSISANFSETDQRNCGEYVEISYLDGKVIQIQTEDNIWQTISDQCKLTLNNGNILDLSMKNIQDPQGNVLLDFSRIILDSENNIELTPMSDEMEAIQENVIPKFTVNNTPGDSGVDGQSGTIGLTGVDGNAGNKGQQGEAGSSEDISGSKPDQFPVFTVDGWKVGTNFCKGTILVSDQSDVLANETSTLFSQLYLVDLDTGEKILLPECKGVLAPNQFDFKGVKDQTSGIDFEFTGLKTDHAYMLYAAAPVELKNHNIQAYVRTFISKTFWTDSAGVYMESAYIEPNRYQVAIYNNNINSGVDVYIINAPFKDYNEVANIKLSDLTSTGSYSGRLAILWDSNNSEKIVSETKYFQYDADINGKELNSNTFYYTILAFDANNDGSIDDYSTQILATKTLKKKPSIGVPTISANRAIWGYDISPGLLVDNDNAVIKYSYEFYCLDTNNFIDTNVETSSLQLKNGSVPTKVVEMPNNAASSVSLGGAEPDTYVMREVLTVYDNEKEYFIYSQFSNAVKLQASVQPYVYFEQYGSKQTGESTIDNKYSISPYYDSIVGILHITPGTDGYKYMINENSYVEISGESYYYSFSVKDYASLEGDTLINDGTWFPAFSDDKAGTVSIHFLDYADEARSWVSGLKDNTSYHITVFGDLYNSDDKTIEKKGVEIGHCDVTTAPTLSLLTALHMNPSDPSLIKGLRAAAATPTQLTKMGSPLISTDGTYTATQLKGFYNRQLETLYGIKISGYLGNFEDEYVYETTMDDNPIKNKNYYIKGSNNTYSNVTSVEGKNPSQEGWYEKIYNELPSEVWTTKTFTKDELWIEDSNQVYMYYDNSSAKVPDEFIYGVQVVGITEGADEYYVRSAGGIIPKNDDDKVWIYKDYQVDSAGLLEPIKYIYNDDDNEHKYPIDNRVRKVDIIQENSGKKLRELYTINKLIDSSLDSLVVDNVTDYIITSGGLSFSDDTFSVPGYTSFTEAITGANGALFQGYFGATFVIEEMYDYTGNGRDVSLNKQKRVRAISNDLTVDYNKTYYFKDGERYASINTTSVSPRVLKWYVENPKYNPADSTSEPYMLTTDEAINDIVTYYCKNGDSFHEVTFPLNPKALSWYEDADQYTNYFDFVGEKRIYIPFTRTIGDINIKEPFKGSTSSDKKIEYKERSDGYHYYYTAQANFENLNKLADTITYKVYDAVDFYNTNAYRNDAPEYLDWSLLGEDPRITKPNESFTDSFIIQDVQTVADSLPEGTEYVFQQVIGSSLAVHPYEWGWYEEQGGKKVITTDASIKTGKTYYVNNGDNYQMLSNPSNTNPESLGLYEEVIKPSSDTSFVSGTTYYARIIENNSIVYNMINSSNHNTPVALNWYEDVNTVKKLSNDITINPEKHYFYCKDDKTFQEVNVSDIDNPSLLGLCYGDKTLSDDEKFNLGTNTRYYVKLLIKVHSTNQDEPSMSGFSHYDTNTKLSPIKAGYTEDNKVLTSDKTINLSKQYYIKNKGINGDIYIPIETSANEYNGKNPEEQYWYEDDKSSKINSLDQSFDTRKTYYSGSSVVSVSPSAYGWFEDARRVTTDTQINYNKFYYKDTTSTERIDPNINPSQLGWFEDSKILVESSETTINSGTAYYAKNGNEYVKVDINKLNPSALRWFENKADVSNKNVVTAGDTYYAKLADGSFVEVSNPNNPSPSALGWFERDNNTGTKTISSHTSRQAGTTYYVLVGKETYIQVTSATTINPKELGWFQCDKIASSDVDLIDGKTYYYKDSSNAYIEIADVTNINPYAMGLYKDGAKVVSTDVTLNYNKTYYQSATATTKITSFYNPSALGWYEVYKKKSTDSIRSTTKNYTVRYLTNPNAATPVTTDGLELAKITLSYTTGGAAPKICFYPCSRDYAKDASHNYAVNDNENNLFLPDDTFEELYGHQFIIAWTINYHNYLDNKWHVSFPFDASAKTQYQGGTVENTMFSSLATNYQKSKIFENVSNINVDSLPAGKDTTFGKNAYMAIPHNYISLDVAKETPIAYSLLWESGKENEGSTQNKFVLNRTLVSDAYNAAYDYYSGSSSNGQSHTTAYLVGKSGTSDKLFELRDIQLNNKKADFIDNVKAVNYIVSNTNGTVDKYAINDIKINSNQLAVAGIPLSVDPANKGEGDAPVVIPVQLYSNKYVKEKQPLHADTSNTYIKGSSDMGSDSNWTFKSTTSNSDKYSSLFTGVFNSDSTSNTIGNSELFVRARMTAGEINGYYVELKAPKAAIENAAGVRLRFDVYNYIDVDTSVGGSPKANGWYEVIKNKVLTDDTSYDKTKVYYYKNTVSGINYIPTQNGTTGINPHDFQWYELNTDGKTYSISEDTKIESTSTYYYKDGTIYKEIDTNKLNPKAMSWYEDKYGDEILSTDTSINPLKTYRKQTDIKYSLYIDKYLPNEVDTKDSYGVVGTEIKKNEIKADGYVYLYFAIDVSDVLADSRYGIGSDDKIFNGKDGVHISAEYLYESDMAGFSFVKFTENGDSSSWRDALSNRANGIINNYNLGTFAIKTYKQNKINNYYYKTNGKNYIALKTKVQKDYSPNIYTVQPHDVGGEITLNKFGSFFEVAGVSNVKNGSAQLKIKPTRDTLSDLNTIEISAQTGIGDIVVPSLLTTNASAAIKVHTYDTKNFRYDPIPEVGGNDFGIVKFPKSSIYIDFDASATDGNSGAIVERQTANLKYVINNADEDSKIFATVTRSPLNDCKNLSQDQIDEVMFDSYYFVNETGSIPTSTIVTDYNGNFEVVPQINQKALFKKYIGEDKTLANPAYYFKNISNDYPGFDYSRMFIPIDRTSTELLLKALPYSSSTTSKSEFYVYFWVWSLINENPDESEYGWVNVGYTSNKEFLPIKLATDVAPNPVINTFELNHDSYDNRSLKIDLNGTADDLYYIVDLYDNSTGKSIFKSHLFTFAGSNYIYNPIYDPSAPEYVDPTSSILPSGYVPLAPPYTGDKNANLFVFDLDDCVGSDGATKILQGNTLEIDNTTNELKILNPVSASEFFEYGKIGTEPDLTDRYEVKLRAYFKGTGPAILSDPNKYDFEKDDDSVYKVYKYKPSGTGTDINKDKYTTTNAGIHSKTFSIDNDFDMVDIGLSNNSFISAINNPYIEFIIEPLIYGSQSIAYDKFIPLFVHYTPDPADESNTIATDITTEVLTGSLALSNPTITVGSNGEMEFPINEATRIKFDSNYVADGGIFKPGDVVTLYLFSYQDDITAGSLVASKMTKDAAIAKLKSELSSKFDSNNLPKMSSEYDTCKGEKVVGLRLVGALNAKILSKSVKIDNANVEVEGVVTKEYKEKFLDYHQKYDTNEKAKAELLDYLTKIETRKTELSAARSQYENAVSPDAIERYVDDEYAKTVIIINELMGTSYDPNPSKKEQIVVDRIMQNFYTSTLMTPIIDRFNDAALLYGYYDTDATEPVLVIGNDPSNYNVVSYIDYKNASYPADAHTIVGTYDLLKKYQIVYGYEDVQATTKIWVIDVQDGSGSSHQEIVTPPDPSNPSPEDDKKYQVNGTYDAMIKAEEELNNTRKFDYVFKFNLIDCEGSSDIGFMDYSISFYKDGKPVGAVTSENDVNVQVIPGTKNFEYLKSVDEPTELSGGSADYDEIRAHIILTEKSGALISIIKSEGTSISVQDIKYESYNEETHTGDQTIDDLEVVIDSTRLNYGTGVVSGNEDGTLAYCDFSFIHK